MWGIPVPSMVPRSGTGWGVVIRSGSGIPADALGKLGDRYFDTTAGRWYIKRWVANREGAGDSILFPISLFPSVGDFDISVASRIDSALGSSDNVLISDDAPTGWTTAQLFFNSANNVSFRLGNSNGAPFKEVFYTRPTSGWHTFRMSRIGVTLYGWIDSALVVNVDSSGWAPLLTQTGTRALFTKSAASLSLKFCNLKIIGPGGSIIAPLDDGSGTTISNKSGANGVLTDGTPTNFWAQAWVPMDLLV